MVKGIVRRIDDLGRIVIPRELRRNLNINISDLMDIYIDQNTGKLCMEKAWLTCVCCGASEEDNELITYKGVQLCETCWNDIKAKDDK